MSALPPPQPAGPVPPSPDDPALPPPPRPGTSGPQGPTAWGGPPNMHRPEAVTRANQLTPGQLTPGQLTPGQLTPGWRTAYLVSWVGAVLVYASVWRSARTMGLSTWWLGPSSDPQFVAVQLLPFVGPLLAVIAAGRNLRFLPHLGIAVGLVGIGIAAVDVGEFERLALLQFVVAGAGLLASIAALAGLVRRDTATD